MNHPQQSVREALDRDTAINIWHKHCDKFKDALASSHPASPVIDAMLEFASLSRPAAEAKRADAPVALFINANEGLLRPPRWVEVQEGTHADFTKFELRAAQEPS